MVFLGVVSPEHALRDEQHRQPLILGVDVPPVCSDLVLLRKDVSHKENSIRRILSLIRKMPQVSAVLESCG